MCIYHKAGIGPPGKLSGALKNLTVTGLQGYREKGLLPVGQQPLHKLYKKQLTLHFNWSNTSLCTFFVVYYVSDSAIVVLNVPENTSRCKTPSKKY